MNKRLIIIGGGAAGIFGAVNAARMNPALHVTVLEKSNKLLAKVKISGGGRCNVTHANLDIEEMSKQYPRGRHFVKKAFHWFFTTDTISWFEERGVKLKTEADGRMFPVTDSSQTIIDCLLKEAEKYGVEIMLKSEVKSANNENGKFRIELMDGRSLNSEFLLIASGGYPKSSMFGWLKATGHSIVQPAPSLFTFNLSAEQTGQLKHPITKLMGVSVEKVSVRITEIKLEEEGPLLITHWGLSGPAVLRLSAWGAKELRDMGYAFRILINWVPGINEQRLRETFQELRTLHASQKVINRNLFDLPARLWEFIALQSGIKSEWRWADLPAANQKLLMRNLSSYECEVKGKTTFKEEFVTAGGIKLSEVDPNTMMSKKVPNLFFTGEVMDVDGITGGFNFQHAWTSGWVAAKTIAGSSSKQLSEINNY